MWYKFVQPGWEPPVAITENLHCRRDKDHPDDRRVDQNRNSQAESELLDDRIWRSNKSEEHADHDCRSGSDDLSGGGQSVGNRITGRIAVCSVFPNATEQEDLVVHR